MKIDDKVEYQINETSSALSYMIRNYQHDQDFNRSFRTFLDNAYRILNYMEHWFKKNPLFEKWYEEEYFTEKIENDSLLKLFRNMIRGYDVHESPLQHFANGFDKKSQIIQRYSCNEVYEIMETNTLEDEIITLMRYLPDFPEIDLIDLCKFILAKLVYIVKECRKKNQEFELKFNMNNNGSPVFDWFF